MSQSAQRYPFFDSLRGFALILMTIYFFCWDLNYFGVLNYDMTANWFWISFHTTVIGLFLIMVGMNFKFSGASFENPRFRARLKKIGICAFVVSFITFLLSRETWIYFGILHLIFFASFLGPLFVNHPRVAAAFGFIITAMPALYTNVWFDKPVRSIAGLSPYRPNTEDFVPLMPWIGVVLIGIYLGAWVINRQPAFVTHKEVPALSRLGRHSLLFYMLHQLILFPLAWIISRLILD